MAAIREGYYLIKVLKSIIFMKIEDDFVWNLFTIVKNLSILHLVPYFYDEYIFSVQVRPGHHVMQTKDEVIFI